MHPNCSTFQCIEDSFRWPTILTASAVLFLFTPATTASCVGSSTMHHMNRQLSQDTDHHLIERQSRTTPLIITNKCADSIYPGLLTQSGDGPGIGGFELTTGSTRTLSVGEAWQGRVWGRTNCSFNSAGTGPAGRTSNGRACTTGDCGGVVDCKGTVNSARMRLGGLCD